MARVLAILLGIAFLANPAILAQEVDADGSASANDRDTAGLGDEADEGAFTVAPVGTLERPEAGVSIPEIDQAWEAYDRAILDSVLELRQALSAPLDAAIGRGDLEAAEKWTRVFEDFTQQGVWPTDPSVKASVAAAQTANRTAVKTLGEAYVATTKALTVAKRLQEAATVRDEWRALDSGQGQTDIAARPPLDRHGRAIQNAIVADHILTVSQDFVVDVYVNGKPVPQATRSLVLDHFGCQIEKIHVPIRRGDWVVFAVANNRLRWGGSYFFAAAGMTNAGALGFQSKLQDRRWTYVDDPTKVKNFIERKNQPGLPVVPVKNIPDWGLSQIKAMAKDQWTGDPVWGVARLSWIKFVAD